MKRKEKRKKDRNKKKQRKCLKKKGYLKERKSEIDKISKKQIKYTAFTFVPIPLLKA